MITLRIMVPLIFFLPLLFFIWLTVSLQVVNISGDILKFKQEVQSELFGEDARRGHADTYVSINAFLFSLLIFNLRTSCILCV